MIDTISDNIDKILLDRPSANIFVCGDFNAHNIDWIPNDWKTDDAGKNCEAFSVSQGLTQMVDFITHIPDNDRHRPSTLDLFLSSNPEVCKVYSSAPLGNSDHVVVSVDISLSSPSARESPKHRTLYSYEQGDWESFRDFIRDIPLDQIMSLKAEQCAREISSWIQAGIDAFIPCRKFQARPNSSPWFSPACAAAIAHRNHYFHTYKSQPNAENRDLLRKASNSCKRVLNNAKSSYADRTHIRISSQKLGSRDFWRIYNGIVNKNKSLIPPLINGPEVWS